jgi:hypothetical protein
LKAKPTASCIMKRRPLSRAAIASTDSFAPRSLHGFTFTKITAALLWPERLRMSKPARPTMFRTAGSWRRNPSTRCSTASVRCSEAASGSWIATAKYPLSSVGTKAEGTLRHRNTARATTTAKPASAARGRPMVNPTAAV